MNTTTLPEAERTRCEIWTRVMGYHRPVTSWNTGKQQEHADRRFFREGRLHGASGEGLSSRYEVKARD